MENFSAYGYHGLTAAEKWILEQYFECGQKFHLAQYINRQPECINGGLSQGMSNFVADLITGKVSRPNKKPSTFRRDQIIHYHMQRLNQGGYPLRSSRDKKGACEILKTVFDLTENQLIEAYKRIEKSNKELTGIDLHKDLCPSLYL